MSLFSTLYGGGAGAPIGAFAVGNVPPGGDWLKLDGTVYNKADYPSLDTSKMLTFSGQSVGVGPTLAAGGYKVTWITGTTWFAQATSSTQAYKSTDNGANWTSVTLPAIAANSFFIHYVGSMYFLLGTGLTGHGLYYTSTDGVSWTSRSFPSVAGYQVSGGIIAYIAGRYVLTPSYCFAGYYPSLYSTDGINWTTVQVITGLTTGGTHYTTLAGGGWKRCPVVRGRVVMSMGAVNGSADYRMMSSADGLTWQTAYAITVTGYSETGSASGPTGNGGFDAHGNWVDTAYTWVSAATKGNSSKCRKPGIPLFASNAEGGCNLWSWHGDEISEDHGMNSDGTRLPGFSATFNTDFSGSRLLTIQSGVVTWLDVSPTKFRAVPPPTGEYEPHPVNYFVKAR